jgi:hypothetical protein
MSDICQFMQYRFTEEDQCTASCCAECKIYKALGKQIPKKPKHIGKNFFHCPNGCEYVHTYFSDRFYYCPKCGQAIDWTDTP